MNSQINIDDLLVEAADSGDLNVNSLQVLQDSGFGSYFAVSNNADTFNGNEVILLNRLFDDSDSMLDKNNDELVRKGANEMMEAICDPKIKKKNNVFVQTSTINRKNPIHTYVLAENAPKIDGRNFKIDGGTPLLDGTLRMLGSLVAEMQQYKSGPMCNVRTISVIVTDGAELHSKSTFSDVKTLVEDLKRQECHLIFGLGLYDGRTDFKAQFAKMGIEERFVLTPNDDPKEIMKAFRLISQSVAVASLGGQSFNSVMNQTGFGN